MTAFTTLESGGFYSNDYILCNPSPHIAASDRGGWWYGLDIWLIQIGPIYTANQTVLFNSRDHQCVTGASGTVIFVV